MTTRLDPAVYGLPAEDEEPWEKDYVARIRRWDGDIDKLESITDDMVEDHRIVRTDPDFYYQLRYAVEDGAHALLKRNNVPLLHRAQMSVVLAYMSKDREMQLTCLRDAYTHLAHLFEFKQEYVDSLDEIIKARHQKFRRKIGLQLPEPVVKADPILDPRPEQIAKEAGELLKVLQEEIEGSEAESESDHQEKDDLEEGEDSGAEGETETEIKDVGVVESA